MRKFLVFVVLFLALSAGAARAQFCPGASPYVFIDVPDSDPFCAFITQMAVEGITEGCEVVDANTRRYCPDDSVTRKQMAAFLARLMNRGVTLYSVVNANGTLARDRGVTTVNKLGTGTYEVIFDRNVTSCVYTATVGPSGGGSALGEVNIASRGGNANGVFVDTNTSAGTAADLPFHLLVTC